MKEKLLRIEEVALTIGVSCKTINNWYWFKREHPDSKLASLLPDYIQDGDRQLRQWRQSDIWKLLEFKNSIPRGRGGIMGDITQRYYAKRKENNNVVAGS
jgi:hypothetical protein